MLLIFLYIFEDSKIVYTLISVLTLVAISFIQRSIKVSQKLEAKGVGPRIGLCCTAWEEELQNM